jgi:hypothetical protein
MEKKIKNISRAFPLAVALGVILIAATLAVTSAQAQPPPIKIECTFYPRSLPTRVQGYSPTKVAPKDIAWLKPGADAGVGPGIDASSQSGGGGYIVLGRGIGHLTASTDRRELTVQLAQVASDHGANAINYQMFNQGTQMRVQFLRIADAILQRERVGRP